MLAWHGSCNRDSGDVTFNACLCQCFKSLQLSYRRNLCVAGAAVHQSNKDFAIHINSYHFNSHLHTSVCFVSQLMTSLAFQPQPSSHLSSPSFFFTLHSTCTAPHSTAGHKKGWDDPEIWFQGRPICFGMNVSTNSPIFTNLACQTQRIHGNRVRGAMRWPPISVALSSRLQVHVIGEISQGFSVSREL